MTESLRQSLLPSATAQLLHRRDALRFGLGLLACPFLHACSDDAPATSPTIEFADDAATVAGDVVTIDLARVPQWRTAPAGESAVVFLSARVIVVRHSSTDYRALSSVCPHAGCGVSQVRQDALVCPCHGSTFTYGGDLVSGPASRGLALLPVTHDPALQRLVIRRQA